MQGLRSPVGLAPPPAYTVPPVSRANPAGDVGLQGLRSAPWRRSTACLHCAAPFHGLIPQGMLGCRGCAPPVGLASPPAYTVPPVSRANPAGDVGLQGFRSPVGLAPPPAYTVPPVSRANPAGDVGLQGLRSPVGLASPPAYTVPPVSQAKIVFMPVVARRRGYIEIFFRVIYC